MSNEDCLGKKYFCLFVQIGFLPQPGKESLLQMLICYKYAGVSHFLLEHCCHLVDEQNSKDSKSANVLLETVPILSLINGKIMKLNMRK